MSSHPHHPTPEPRSRNWLVLLTAAFSIAAMTFITYTMPSGQEKRQQFAEFPKNLAAPSVGSGTAHDVVVFIDYGCPGCKAFEEEQLDLLKDQVLGPANARLLLLHSPFLKPESKDAAVAAYCVYEQSNEKFWTYNRVLFAAQGPEDQAATEPLLSDEARKLGLDMAAFAACRSGPGKQAVANQLALHQQAGMQGTPAAFVDGHRVPAGSLEIAKKLNELNTQQ